MRLVYLTRQAKRKRYLKPIYIQGQIQAWATWEFIGILEITCLLITHWCNRVSYVHINCTEYPACIDEGNYVNAWRQRITVWACTVIVALLLLGDERADGAAPTTSIFDQKQMN